MERSGWIIWRNDEISNQADRHVLSPHISNQADRHVLSPHFQSSVGLVLQETMASGGKGHRFRATGKDRAQFPGRYLGGTTLKHKSNLFPSGINGPPPSYLLAFTWRWRMSTLFSLEREWKPTTDNQIYSIVSSHWRPSCLQFASDV